MNVFLILLFFQVSQAAGPFRKIAAATAVSASQVLAGWSVLAGRSGSTQEPPSDHMFVDQIVGQGVMR